MLLIVTGVVFLIIGGGNLAMGRLRPDRPSSGLSKGLGYVGVVIGIINLIGGIAYLAGWIPEPPPKAKP